MHELRKDPLLSRWVAVLEQSLGPGDYSMPADNSGEKTCLLCSGREKETPAEVSTIRAAGSGPDTPGWSVRAIPSPMPSLSQKKELGRKGVGIYDKMNSVGANELIIETPEHETMPEDMGAGQVRNVLEVYRQRIHELEKDPRIRYVLICKNSGRWAGALYTHPHSVVVATPVIPQNIKVRLDGAKQYYAYKERCIFCDIMDEELRADSRVILKTEHFVAFCPFAPSSPFEFWIMPRTHRCAFEDASAEELDDLSAVMAALLKKMRKALGEPSYYYAILTAPNRVPRRDHWHTLGDDFHWYVEVVPRITNTSGVEWSSGFYMLGTSPEDAAKYMREA